MLLRIGIGVGVVDQQSTSGAALPPVLTWTSPSSDNTPDFTVDISLTSAVAGNVVTLQIDTNSSFPAPTTYTHTLTAPEILAGSFSMATGTIADGTYFARCRITGTGWSNTVTVTIATTPVRTHLAHKVAFTNVASTDFTNVDIGTAAANRFIVIAATGTNSAVPGATCTVGGVALTRIAVQGSVNAAAIYGGLVTTGSGNQTVTIDFGVTSFENKAIEVWSVTNLSSTTVKSSDAAPNGGGSGNLSLNVSAGDLAFCVEFNGSSASANFVGSDQTPDNTYDNFADNMLAGDWTAISTDASFLITNTNFVNGVAASWR